MGLTQLNERDFKLPHKARPNYLLCIKVTPKTKWFRKATIKEWGKLYIKKKNPAEIAILISDTPEYNSKSIKHNKGHFLNPQLMGNITGMNIYAPNPQ